jgi:hypothetical protein
VEESLGGTMNKGFAMYLAKKIRATYWDVKQQRY